MKIQVCDICKEKCPKVKIKYKYKAKRFWFVGLDAFGWEKIDICDDCLDMIIIAKEEIKE